MTGRARNHLLLGVTGGIATGKSAVADLLQEKGALTIDFDLLAREIQAPGQPAYQEIVSHFGPDVVLENGMLNRRRLSEIVFADPQKKSLLERFTHGRIRAAFHEKFNRYIVEQPDATVQAVIPLLIESRMQALFDRILVIYAPAAVQLRRLVRRDQLSEEHARRILASQLDIEQKRAQAGFVIDNSGELSATRQQVDDLWNELQALKEQRADGSEKKPREPHDL